MPFKAERKGSPRPRRSMITYKSDVFGLKTLFIWHGSAVFRAVVPAGVSTCIMIPIRYWYEVKITAVENRRLIEHPYVITVFIAFFSFLLAFRLNYSYQRVRRKRTLKDIQALFVLF